MRSQLRERDRVMSAIWRRLFKLSRLVCSRVRLSGVRMRYGFRGFPSDLALAADVRVTMTDGGVIDFGGACEIDRGSSIIAKYGRLVFGPRTYVGVGSVICARQSISIGADVLIAEYVTIRDQDHAFGGAAATAASGFTTAPIVIGDNVWLGAKVTVTKGVTIGAGSVIGANSVVTRDIPANCVAAGAPARIIREINREPGNFT